MAKRTKGFDPKKTPKTLRVGVDSRPLEGAGRVEDTINLLGHAARSIVRVVSKITELVHASRNVCQISVELSVFGTATVRPVDQALYCGFSSKNCA